MSDALKAIAELYKHAVGEGALTGDATLDAAIIKSHLPNTQDAPTTFKCCSPNCPGFNYRASEWAHPADICTEIKR